MNNFIDLSHVIESGMITYPGLPGPVIKDFMSREGSKANYAEGVTFHIGLIEMVANTGTYLDSPFHRYKEGRDLADLPLKCIANLPGFVIHCQPTIAINSDAFTHMDFRGAAVLFHTGWDKYWKTPEYTNSDSPYLTSEACERLIEGGAALVGIDSINIDDRKDLNRPAHSLLLKAGIPIVEHLCNLQSLPDAGFRLFAIPPKIKNFGSFPVRAFALLM